MPEGDKRIHRQRNAKVSDFPIGKVDIFPNDSGLAAAGVVFEARSEGSDVVVTFYPATENNKAEARKLGAAD